MIMKHIAFIANALLAAVLVGCSSTNFKVSDDVKRVPFSGKVLVFEQRVPENVDYAVIGTFVQQKQWYGGTGETDREAITSAADEGANAILVERSGHRVTKFSWASPYTEGKLLWVNNYDAAAKRSATATLQNEPQSTGDRLKQLDALRKQGLITETEYDIKRKAILDSM